jgi:hypothetical protein
VSSTSQEASLRVEQVKKETGYSPSLIGKESPVSDQMRLSYARYTQAERRSVFHERNACL